jgi:glycosyltransferase involved in cell wall biosynthesis
LLGLLSRLDREKIECAVVTPSRGELNQELEKLSIPVFVQPLTRWVVSTNGGNVRLLSTWRDALAGLSWRVKAVRRLITRLEIDAVYTNTVTCIDGAIAARIASCPHVWHLREQISGNRDLRGLLPARITSGIVYALSDHIIVNSRALQAAYARRSSANKTSVVYNGVDTELFSPAPACRTRLIEDLGVRSDAKVIGVIGSITPRKCLETVVSAASHVLREIRSAAFVIVGEGRSEYVNQIKARVAGAGLRESFHFLGWRSDVSQLLPGMDMLLSASDQEAFGRTLIEAMSCGLPVVATRSGGPEEIVLDGETGFLVPAGDAQAMATAISRILSDASLADRFSRAGRARVEELFSLSSYGRHVQTILCSVGEKPHRARRNSDGRSQPGL